MVHKTMLKLMKSSLCYVLCFFCSISAWASSKNNSVLNEARNYAVSYDCIVNKCKFFLEKNNGETEKLLLEVPARSPSVSWLSNDLAQIVLSCGSNCHINYYYHLKRGVSEALQEVLAVKPDKMCVLVAGVDGLSVFGIFDKKKNLVIKYSNKKLNFDKGRAVMYMNMEASFLQDGALELNYIDADGEKRRALYKGACL